MIVGFCNPYNSPLGKQVVRQLLSKYYLLSNFTKYVRGGGVATLKHL